MRCADITITITDILKYYYYYYSCILLLPGFSENKPWAYSRKIAPLGNIFFSMNRPMGLFTKSGVLLSERHVYGIFVNRVKVF